MKPQASHRSRGWRLTMHTWQVRDWMTPDPIGAAPDMALHEALQLKVRHRIRHLNGVENGKLVSIATRCGLRRAQPSPSTSLSIFELHYLVGRITLDKIITRYPLTVTDTTTIKE